jgi:methylphosphotriester-DNA--protein-cysteine methyltransferase
MPLWRERVGNGDAVAATDAMLRKLLRMEESPRVDAAVQHLIDGGSVDSAARTCNWSPRHMERVLLKSTGLPPKLLSRIGRFQRALRMHAAGLDWAATAYAAGFSDQSHLIRDFRQFAGTAPTTLERSALTEALVR